MNIILLYGCCYSTIYVVSGSCLSLYLNIAGLRQGPGKLCPGKSSNFCNQESGNPVDPAVHTNTT